MDLFKIVGFSLGVGLLFGYLLAQPLLAIIKGQANDYRIGGTLRLQGFRARVYGFMFLAVILLLWILIIPTHFVVGLFSPESMEDYETYLILGLFILGVWKGFVSGKKGYLKNLSLYNNKKINRH